MALELIRMSVSVSDSIEICAGLGSPDMNCWPKQPRANVAQCCSLMQ